MKLQENTAHKKHVIPADTENQENGDTMGRLQVGRIHVPQGHLGHLAPIKFAKVEFCHMQV